jgi:hypothetical protein
MAAHVQKARSCSSVGQFFSTKLVDLTSSKSKKTGTASAHGHFIYDRHNVTSVQRCGVYQIGLFESGFGM